MKDFINPGSQYRGAPFWAWNGKLDPDELRRQIRVMHRMGLGGFFMHSRVGLATEYLSEDWFECVNACIDEAEKLDMQAWLYDEDRWPSGAAGGLVTKNQKYRRRALGVEVLKPTAKLNWDADTVAAFSARIDNITVSEVKRIAKGKQPVKPAKDMAVLRFFIKIDDCSDWYNGQTYLDTLNDEAVREFIKVTHAVYAKRVGEHFGKRVPGIFTDEPNYGIAISTLTGTTKSVPWTGRLVSVFKERYGYDILKHLPELFFELAGKEISQVRYHYYDCITHLFVDAFSHQIGDWCDQNNMQHTGHVLLEETLSSQTNMVGSAMRFYEYMQAPGIDILTEKKREYDTARQCSSVARQFGRKWRLSETYGCTGWDFSFAGHKGTSNWQAALGINLRCQHLFWYTMEGEAKRDYPASIGYQSSWYDVYPKVEDYFARVNLVMTQGVEVRDLLVIHPIESMWTLFNMDMVTNPRIEEYDTMLIELRDSLLTASIDFDYGDEEIMSRHSKISCKSGEPILYVGKAAYKTVLVPPLLTMRSSTLKLLQRFSAAGGTVVFAGDVTRHIDALPSEVVSIFADKCIRTSRKGKAMVQAVEKTARRISITDADGNDIIPTLYMLREDADAYYLFVCNTGHSKSQLKHKTSDSTMICERRTSFDDVHICGFANCAGNPIELDPETGEEFSAVANRTKNGLEIITGLPALGSRIFIIPKKQQRRQPVKRPLFTFAKNIPLNGIWDIALSENNCLVLDTPSYKVAKGAWRKPSNILLIDYEVRRAMGLKLRGGQMVQPWARERAVNSVQTSVQLKYIFDVKVVPDGDLFLGIERPDTFEILLNGYRLDMDSECGWWCDRSLRKIPLNASHLQKGTNELLLTCCYGEEHSGLEIIYLLGDFGVRVQKMNVSLTASPSQLKVGDWCRQALPFYAGSVSYCRTIRPKFNKNQHLFVSVPEYRGIAVRVLVDGKSAGVIAWEPHEVDVTDLVCGDGSPADLRIEVIGHRRNSHGPLHISERWPYWTGPDQFVSVDKWQDSYNLVPCGLLVEPRLVVKTL